MRKSFGLGAGEIGCGTFDPEARARLHSTLEARMDGALKRRRQRLEPEIADPDARLRVMGELILPLYSHERVTGDLDIEAVDARGHDETWRDMVRLQEQGVDPAACSAISEKNLPPSRGPAPAR